MSEAKCFRCGASATADTFEQACKQLDHSAGLSRGIKCGDNYNRVQEIKEKQLQTKTDDKPKIAEPQTDNPESPVTSEKVKEKKTKPKKEKYL